MRLYGVPLLLITVLLLTAYLPSYSYSYFLNDDFRLATSLNADCHSMVFWKWNLKLGRPLANYVHCGALATIPSLHNFWVGRLLAVICIIAIAFFLYVFFVQNSLGMNWALLLSIAISTLPGMIYASTLLAATPTLLGILAGTLGAICFVKGARSDVISPKKFFFFSGITCCALAVFTYQISVMIIVALLALPLSSNDWKKSEKTTLILSVGGALCLLIGAYLLWYIGSGNLARIESIKYGQSPDSYLIRIAWFAKEVLPRATTVWHINAPNWAGWCIYALFAALLLHPMQLVGRKSKDHRTATFNLAIRISVIFLAPLICYGPVLITNSDKVLFRTLIPLSALILIQGYLAIESSWQPAIHRINNLSKSVIFCILWPLAFLTAWIGLTIDVHPQASELSYMIKTVQTQISDGRCAKHLHFVKPENLYVPLSKKLKTDEFYAISTMFGEGFYPSIGKVVYSLAGISPPEIVSSSRPGEPYSMDECTVVFDMQSFAKSLTW